MGLRIQILNRVLLTTIILTTLCASFLNPMHKANVREADVSQLRDVHTVTVFSHMDCLFYRVLFGSNESDQITNIKTKGSMPIVLYL